MTEASVAQNPMRLAEVQSWNRSRLGGQANLQILAGERPLLDEMSFRLLQGIRFAGCLMDAGRMAGISYRSAHDKLHALALAWGAPLVRTVSGGSRGGNTCLTPDGERLLDLYASLRREHLECIQALNQRLEREWNRPFRAREDAP
jgi:molybdate transport system regulatory protein